MTAPDAHQPSMVTGQQTAADKHPDVTPIRSPLRRWWLVTPAIAVLTAVLVGSMGISNASAAVETGFMVIWLGLAALMTAWILTSRLAVDGRERLSVAHLGWSRSVDLRRLSRLDLHPDAVAGNAAQHWVVELHDSDGGRVRLTTLPVYTRSREVFARVDHAVKVRGVAVSGPARHVLDHVTA